MEEKKEVRKITRRTTRSKTQFINFNKDEINNLRLEATNNNKNKDVIQIENILKDSEIRTKAINSGIDSLKTESPEPLDTNAEENVNVFSTKYIGKPISIIKPEEVFGTKISFNNTPVEKQKPLTEKEQRTYSFSELLDWVHKKEKRELFPKNKFDYVYKKNKNDCKTKLDNENDERNVVHMRIEEDIIPCLSSNPFIQADKYFRNKY
ncbi:hypothetical protein P3W45_000452 [Vairimorpha bombi]|jgi:hypothetical protein